MRYAGVWALLVLFIGLGPAVASDKGVKEVQTRLSTVVQSMRTVVPARELQLFSSYYNKLIELSLKHGGLSRVARSPRLLAELYQTPMPAPYRADAYKVLAHLDDVAEKPSLICGDLLSTRPLISKIRGVKATQAAILGQEEWTYSRHAMLSRDLVELISSGPFISSNYYEQIWTLTGSAQAAIRDVKPQALLNVISSEVDRSLGFIDFIRVSFLPLHYVAVDFYKSRYDGRAHPATPREKTAHDLEHALDKGQALAAHYLKAAGDRELKTKDSWLRFLNEVENESRLINRFYKWHHSLQRGKGNSKELSKAIATLVFVATHEEGAMMGLSEGLNFKYERDGFDNDFYTDNVISRISDRHDLGIDSGLIHLSKTKLDRLLKQADDEIRAFLRRKRI